MRKKAVKVEVRKWVTCSEPGCKRRAGTAKPYCGEHQQQFEEKKEVAAAIRKARRLYKEAQSADHKKRKADPKKSAAKLERQWLHKKVKDAAAARRAASPLPSSRLIKAHCEKCDYTIRLSRKWIDVKRPMCPVCMKNMVTELDGLLDADPRQLKLKTVKKRGMIKQRGV